MKHLFSCIVVLLLFIAICNDLCAQSQRLVVWMKSGEKVYYQLEERPKTTFSEGNIVITTNTIEAIYPLEQVLRYTYENVSSDISSLPIDNMRVTQQGNVFTMENMKPETVVHLYSIDGKLLERFKVNSTNAISISLETYPSGVYIIKANGVTYKMMKR